jgi:hypothetical protein
MFFPALLAKFLSAGAVAQACSGAGIVLVAFTGAGAAGVLPGPVQDTFSSVVGTETADETPAPEDTTGTGADGVTDLTGTEDTEIVPPAPEAPVVASPSDLTLEDWEQGPGPDQSFGDWVSSGARQGYADGAMISCWAHHRNDERKGREVTECAPAASAEGTETVDAPEVETPEAETSGDSADTEQSTDGDRGGNRGQGNGGGNGHGGGGGNSGRGHN